MKPSFNVNVDRTDTGRAGFRWNYRERKVGVYLTLHCPLQTRPTERRTCGADMVAWETSVCYEPREYLTVYRETHLYTGERKRRLYTTGKKLLVHKSYADLSVAYSFSGEYVPVKDLGDGKTVERWKVIKRKLDYAGEVRGLVWRSNFSEKETTVGPPRGFDLSAFHVDLRSAIDGCAAQGRFDVLMDWFIEKSPDCVADLFSNPGPL